MHQGGTFKRLVEERSISKADIADKMEVERQTVYLYFKSKKFSEDVLQRVLNALDMDLDTFISEVKKDAPHLEEPSASYGSMTIEMLSDAMHPAIYKGDRIVCRPIEGKIIIPGRAYVIETKKDKLQFVRFVDLNGPDSFVLRPENPKYQSQRIDREDIHRIYTITQIIAYR